MISYALEGEGAPVLLIHGLGGDRRQSLAMLPPGLHRTRIAPELPGHGDTALHPAQPVDYGSFVALIGELLARLAGRIGPGPMPVVGVSMGAATALRLAAERPDVVTRLVLVRPSTLDQPNPPGMLPFVEIGRLLAEFGPREGKERFRTTDTYRQVAEESPAMAASLLGQFDRPEAAARSRVLREVPGHVPLARDTFASIRVPALVLGAPGDPVHDIGIARTWAEWLPDARFSELPHKGLDAAPHQAALQVAVAAEIGETNPAESAR